MSDDASKAGPSPESLADMPEVDFGRGIKRRRTEDVFCPLRRWRLSANDRHWQAAQCQDECDNPFHSRSPITTR